MRGTPTSGALGRLGYGAYLVATSAALVELGARLWLPGPGDAASLLPQAWDRLLNSTVQPAPGGRPTLTPGARQTLQRGDLTYTVAANSLGLRGPEPPPRAPGQYRVLFLGDSMVFGDGLEEEETIPARLQAAAGQAGWPVIAVNGAISGMATVDELLVARALVPRLAPDLVVLGFFVANDPLPNAIATVDDSGRLAIDEAAAAGLRARLEAHLRPLAASAAFRAIALPAYVPRLRYTWSAQPAIVARSCALVEAIGRVCTAGGADLAVLVIYARDGVAGGLWDLWSGSRRVGRRVGGCLRERGIEVLDTTEFMSGRRARLDYYFERDGHLNERGADRVAAEVARRLVRPRLGSP